MDRRTKKWLQHNAKILAVCGGVLYLAAGVAELAGESQNPEVPEKMSAQVPYETVILAETLEVQEETEETAEPAEPVELVEAEPHTTVMSMDLDADDSYLLARLAMAEAEGEDTYGKALVMLVALNRVLDDEFPDTVRDVIYQPVQFSPISDGRFAEVEPDADCLAALDLVMLEKWDGSCGATYFESDSESTWHQNNLEFLFQRGNFYFYKDKEK